jgi:hypothetical protein
MPIEKQLSNRADNLITLPITHKVSPVTIMTGKQFALHIENVRNKEIEMYNSKIIDNESEMQRLRSKHNIGRHSFFKLPLRDFRKFHKLQRENFLCKSAIFTLMINEF